MSIVLEVTLATIVLMSGGEEFLLSNLSKHLYHYCIIIIAPWCGFAFHLTRRSAVMVCGFCSRNSLSLCFVLSPSFSTQLRWQPVQHEPRFTLYTCACLSSARIELWLWWKWNTQLKRFPSICEINWRFIYWFLSIILMRVKLSRDNLILTL